MQEWVLNKTANEGVDCVHVVQSSMPGQAVLSSSHALLSPDRPSVTLLFGTLVN